MEEKNQLERQHEKGKLNAVERINLLLDKNSFLEIGGGIEGYYVDIHGDTGKVPYDGVITGYGTVNGQTVYVYSQDFSVFGGTLALKHGHKIAHIIEQAIRARCPIVGIYDSGGARIQEGVNALAGCGEMLYYNTLASGYIPQISVVVGPCAGASAYSPGITDFVFIVDKIGHLFVTGSEVVKRVTGEDCTLAELGGAAVHARISGVAHFFHAAEGECFRDVRQLISILPPSADRQNLKNEDNKYVKKSFSKINNIIPQDGKRPYDIKRIINELVDEDSFIEVHKSFAISMVIGFGRLCGITIGIVANQPQFYAGTIECDSSDKAARFVRFCDAYDIPIITLVDTPGYMPGIQQESKGIVRHGAKLLYAYAEATTTKITVILRKAYGGAYIAMCSKHLRADYVYAWPQAEVAVMGAEGAVSILYSSKMKTMTGDIKEEFKNKMIQDYKDNYMNANTVIEEGYVDAIISPLQTRERIFRDLVSMSQSKYNNSIKKKHGNIPL